jgi:hypothetical protein
MRRYLLHMRRLMVGMAIISLILNPLEPTLALARVRRNATTSAELASARRTMSAWDSVAVSSGSGGGGGGVAALQAPEPPELPAEGKIVFESSHEGNSEIYVVDADGSNQTKLTNNDLTHDEDPAWSPDGKKIAYLSVTAGGAEGGSIFLRVMNADGSNNQLLLSYLGRSQDVFFMWSPDGKQILVREAYGYNCTGGFVVWSYSRFTIVNVDSALSYFSLCE